MKIGKEQLEALKQALQFYANGENLGWDGCRCHGHLTDEDHGNKAEEGLTIITAIEETEEVPCEICKQTKIIYQKCPHCGWEG